MHKDTGASPRCAVRWSEQLHFLQADGLEGAAGLQRGGEHGKGCRGTNAAPLRREDAVAVDQISSHFTMG